MPDAKPIELEDPAVFALLAEFDALRTWEVLRRARAVRTVAELAAATGAEVRLVQRQLDLLVARDLVRVVRARKPRRSIGYRAATDRLVVTFDDRDPHAVARALESSDLVSREFDRCVEAHADPEFQPKAGFRFRQRVIEHFTPEEFAELRRRMLAVVEFLSTPRPATPDPTARNAKREPRRFCNQAIRIEFEPLVGELLPLPAVWMTPRSKFERGDAGDRGGTGIRELAPREREVALALADGLTRAHVAERIGLSVHTVATVARRIYRKLGVSSQAELAARLAGHTRREVGER